MELAIDLDFDEKSLETFFRKHFIRIFNSFLAKIGNKSLESSRLIVRQAITDSPEYYSLLGRGATDLQAHFGLIAPTTIVNDIIYQIQDAMRADIILAKGINDLNGGISIKILKSNFSDALSARNASYLSKDHVIDWLRWLLFEGTRPITREGGVSYDIEFGFYPKSRSKKAVMKQKSSTWSVPHEFAGTVGDNWLTRAMNGIEVKVAEIIKAELNKVAL